MGGFQRVYEIGRVFRNEGMDPKHNPEFTMMELYQAYTDYNGMMDLIEDTVSAPWPARSTAPPIIHYGDVTIDLDKPFERMTMVEAVKKYTGVDFDDRSQTLERSAASVADEHHLHYEAAPQEGRYPEPVLR